MKKWQLVAIGTALAGLPIWFVSHLAYASSRGLALPSMIFLILFSAFVFVQYDLTARRVILSQGLAFVVATIIKILIDTAINSADHNLFPFELVFAAAMGFIAGALGVGIGWTIRSIKAYLNR